MNKELKNHLAIKQWLELLKEDKNLCGAYISLSQYINIVENENTSLELALNEIRELVKNLDDNLDDIMCYDIDRYKKQDILQIIDKVGGSENEKSND